MRRADHLWEKALFLRAWRSPIENIARCIIGASKLNYEYSEKLQRNWSRSLVANMFGIPVEQAEQIVSELWLTAET